MKIGCWYEGYKDYAPLTKGKVDVKNRVAHISLCGKYSTATICCIVEEYDNTGYLEVHPEKSVIKASVDRVLRWYDKDGNLLYMYHGTSRGGFRSLILMPPATVSLGRVLISPTAKMLRIATRQRARATILQPIRCF